jgi:hypothetical protein
MAHMQHDALWIEMHMIAYVLYVYMGMSQNEEEITEKKIPLPGDMPISYMVENGG